MDINIIIAEIVKNTASSLINTTVKAGTTQYQKIQVVLETCFTAYLNRSYQQYTKIKTLLYRDQPVDLSAHYVATDFSLGRKKISGDVIFDSLNKNQKNVITGTAGSGKSVLLRKLFIDLIENKNGTIPILIELRHLLTTKDDYSIVDFIHKTLADINAAFTKEQLEYALKKGTFTLFLDGFDEISFDKKKTYEAEILEISNKYSETTLVISSRPDDETFASWQEFYVYRAQPMNKTQSIALISKIQYDHGVKTKFIKKLEEGLYEQHQDFLSNPLLLTMMLLTYEQLAEVPEKIHIFYEQAFETLFHKHDASKQSVFKRKSYSGLPIDDFKKIFAAFCMITYAARKMSFTKSELTGYIQKALALENQQTKADDFFKDLVESVCMLQQDGNLYIFSHRSFQEYFTAYFMSKSQSKGISKALDKIINEYFGEEIVISLLFELDREKIETVWILPRLKKIIDDTQEHITNQDTLAYLSVFYAGFSVFNDRINLVLPNEMSQGYFYLCLEQLYRKEMLKYFPDKSKREQIKEDKKNYELFIKNTNVKSNIKPVIDFRFDKLAQGDTAWLAQTSFPDLCLRHSRFIDHLHETLTNKYKEKDESLEAILIS